jgi:hypothetical protein
MAHPSDTLLDPSTPFDPHAPDSHYKALTTMAEVMNIHHDGVVADFFYHIKLSLNYIPSEYFPLIIPACGLGLLVFYLTTRTLNLRLRRRV